VTWSLQRGIANRWITRSRLPNMHRSSSRYQAYSITSEAQIALFAGPGFSSIALPSPSRFLAKATCLPAVSEAALVKSSDCRPDRPCLYGAEH
jgi:hypothetical protein